MQREKYCKQQGEHLLSRECRGPAAEAGYSLETAYHPGDFENMKLKAYISADQIPLSGLDRRT